jgi:hypothetical protein
LLLNKYYLILWAKMKINTDPSTWFKGQAKRSYDFASPAPLPPDKVFIQNDGTINNIRQQEYFAEPPENIRVAALLDSFYGSQNMLTLGMCLPEIFAPIHEIASRVADANWQLVKSFGDSDNVDYKDETFNRLFTQPNVFQSHKQLVYNAVFYEILTGKTLWHFNQASFLGNGYKDIIGWFNLPAHKTRATIKKGIDIYTATSINDIVQDWRHPIGEGKTRVFQPDDVLPIVHFDIDKGYDLNCPVPLIKGAEKAIRNLLPVYEARGVIYIKQGAIGMWVNKGKDANGPFILTDEHKKEIVDAHQQDYGITRGKRPAGYTSADLDFIRTALSIKELEPFSETLADAVAIYATLRVPRHLVPSKDQSTFANADADLKSFYQDVIIPWAGRYAQVWTNGMRLETYRRFIRPDYSHIDILQENKKEKADTDKQNGTTWLERFKAGVCTLNEWISSFDGNKGTEPLYDKKLLEMDPDEENRVLLLLKGISQQQQEITNEQASQQNTGTQAKGGNGKLQVA